MQVCVDEIQRKNKEAEVADILWSGLSSEDIKATTSPWDNDNYDLADPMESIQSAINKLLKPLPPRPTNWIMSSYAYYGMAKTAYWLNKYYGEEFDFDFNNIEDLMSEEDRRKLNKKIDEVKYNKEDLIDLHHRFLILGYVS